MIDNGIDVEAIFEAAVAAGQNIGDRKVYVPMLKDLAQKTGLKYTTLFNRLKAFRLSKLAPSPSPPATITQPIVGTNTAQERTTLQITAEPKPPLIPPPQQTIPAPPPAGEVQLTEEEYKMFVKGLYTPLQNMLYSVLQNTYFDLYNVKVKKSSDEDIDNMVDITAKALSAYNINIGKWALAIGAVGSLVGTTAAPLLIAQSEVKKIQADRDRREQELKKKSTTEVHPENAVPQPEKKEEGTPQ